VARMLCLVAACRKKPNFCAIYIYMHHFTKTGWGQT
jgi:hypothetical protein